MHYPTLRPFLFGLLITISVALAPGAPVPRTEINLNAGWRFHFGETAAAELVTFNDAAWSSVTLPHTWNALDGQDGVKKPSEGFSLLKGDYARGSGWYRRTLRFEPAWKGRRVYLQFDGANRRADVFLNGQFVGTHLGGNARFRFDLTNALKSDSENILAVKVNNEDNGIAPHSGDFTFFGGLYRNVALIVTDAVQIETMDHASPGIYLEQTNVTAQRAELKVRVLLANHESTQADISVRAIITDASGKVVQTATTTTSVAAGGSGQAILPVTMEQPHLWNGRVDPYLYTTRIEIGCGGALRDAIEQPLGLRFFAVDPQRGFLLNGHYLDLRGVSRHQDRIDKGWAISPDDEREDMALITEMGCTAIRVAHYQQSPLWYELADEQGLVLWSEIPFVDEALPGEKFFNTTLEQMRELIRQNYNHPSICFWGCGNENFDEGQDFAHGITEYAPHSEGLIQALNALAHAEDSTRLTTYASFHSEKEIHLALPGQAPVDLKGEPQRWYTDVTAFNKYYGWYTGEPEDNAEFFDSMHQRNPNQRIGISEYGAGGSIAQHDAAGYGGPSYKRTGMENMRRAAFGKIHPEEYQAYYHEHAWKVFSERPYLWAKFIWNVFDFASDGRDEGEQPGRNDKGLVSFDRKTRKDAFYFYKASWNVEPMIHVTSSRVTPRTDATTEVKIYSNAASVELSVNGQSLGTHSGEDRVFRWSGVTLRAGENRVRAATVGSPPSISDECVWSLIPKP